MAYKDGDVVRVVGGAHARRTGTVASDPWGGDLQRDIYVDLEPYGRLEAEEDVPIPAIFLVKAERHEKIEGEYPVVLPGEVELMALVASIYEMCREKETEALGRIAAGVRKNEFDVFHSPEEIRAELQGIKDQARRTMMLIHDTPLWPVLQAQIDDWATARRGQNSTGMIWGF